MKHLFKDIAVDHRKGSVTLKFDNADDITTLANKKMHDITSALRTFEMAVESLKNGYRFDDELASAKINALAKSVATTKEQLDVLTVVYAKILA